MDLFQIAYIVVFCKNWAVSVGTVKRSPKCEAFVPTHVLSPVPSESSSLCYSFIILAIAFPVPNAFFVFTMSASSHTVIIERSIIPSSELSMCTS